MQSYCYDCNRESCRLRRRRDMDSEGSTRASTLPLPELESDLEYHRRTEREASEEPSRKRRRQDDSLYILEIDPGDEADRRLCRHVLGIKIGRTYDVDERCKTLAHSMPFRMKLLAEFPECAHLEHKIHEYFCDKRNSKGFCREWFHVTLGEAVRLIGSLMGGTNTDDADRTTTSSASGG